MHPISEKEFSPVTLTDVSKAIVKEIQDHFYTLAEFIAKSVAIHPTHQAEVMRKLLEAKMIAVHGVAQWQGD